MGAIASQITSLTIIYSTVYSGAYQSKHQSSASLAFVWGIHRGPVNFPRKWPVTRKLFPFDDVIMRTPTICISRVPKQLNPHRWTPGKRIGTENYNIETKWNKYDYDNVLGRPNRYAIIYMDKRRAGKQPRQRLTGDITHLFWSLFPCKLKKVTAYIYIYIYIYIERERERERESTK